MKICDNKREGYKMKPEDFSAIDRKIHDLLIAEGYTITNAGKIKAAANLNINNIAFQRGEMEIVQVLIHKPITEAVAKTAELANTGNVTEEEI